MQFSCNNYSSNLGYDPEDFDDDDFCSTFHWIDFNVIDAENKTFKFRIEYNQGDADANTGAWGNVWNRESGEAVISISDARQDSTSYVYLTSKAIKDVYKSHNDPVFLDKNQLVDDSFLTNLYTSDHELEKITGVAMRISPQDCIGNLDYKIRVEIQAIVLERIFSSKRIFLPLELIHIIAEYAPAPIELSQLHEIN